jgi:nucleoid DNA-binding protein
LNPSKRKDISKLAAKKLKLNEKLVDDIAAAYFYKVQKMLSSLEYPTVYVPNFGTFDVKRKALYEQIDKCNDMIKYYESQENTMKNFNALMYYKKNLEIYQKTLNDVLIEKERKETIKNKKDEFERNNEE